MILQKMKKTVEDYLGQEITEAVITVPAYFSGFSTSGYKRSRSDCRSEVKRIVNEPTAAALAYGIDKANKVCEGCRIRPGGGTLDISIPEFGGGYSKYCQQTVIRPGGDDFDR